MRELLDKIRRVLHKPPKFIFQRLVQEIRDQGEFFLARRRAWAFKRGALLRVTGHPEINCLWDELGEKPYFGSVEPLPEDCYQSLCPGDRNRIMQAAETALRRQVNLLGSGPVDLGDLIDWRRDYKTGFCWRHDYFRRINYNNPGQSSDVKFPWELSRLQWLIPAGQAYLLTGDERYAAGVRDILEDWIDHNPYSFSVNWACTMEVALRIFTWSWFFYVFRNSRAWKEPGFRLRFLSCFFLHGDFTARHLENSDINGNHYTADAAGLVVAGLFFGTRRAADRWGQRGWEILTREIKGQIYPDGVDFEMSVAYHRLVLELFFVPALYRKTCGLPVPDDYRDRLIAMARFTAFYSRDSGSTPLWGDADDGRVLPFGGQSINDHRYLTGLVGVAWEVSDLMNIFRGPRDEIVWWLGPDEAARLPGLSSSGVGLESQAFPDAGFYIMRNGLDHIFIDCGPVGLAGRGGHGHNDCLAFEAVLDGVELVTDCGAYLYTASYQERNRFRSTACHNTPQVDGIEINRFTHPDQLWSLHDDAHPQVKYWGNSLSRAIFIGSHDGYQKLKDPVIPERTLILDHQQHALVICDRFWGHGDHLITIPLHLAAKVEVQPLEPGRLRLTTGERYFWLDWDHPGDWDLQIEPARISPSYGIIRPIVRLVWRRQGALDKSLTLLLRPADKKNEVEFQLGKVFELLRDMEIHGERDE